MKTAGKLIILALTFLALAASTHAETLEQFQQMVEQLQKTPDDKALREQLIKLATSIEPVPAIPEEAREPFIMGVTVLKKASDHAGAGKATDLFTRAINLAPWFADAYYNRAISREAAGQFEAAVDDLKLYLVFKLSDAERREAQDKIYSLKADALLASTKKADEAAILEKAAREKVAYDWLLGEWRLSDDMRDVVAGGRYSPIDDQRVQSIKNGDQVLFRLGGKDFLRAKVREQAIVWEHWKDIPYQMPNRPIHCPEDGVWNRVEVTISTDKKKMSFSFYSSHSGTCGHQGIHYYTLTR